MTKQEFLALGIDETSGPVTIYLKTRPHPLRIAELRAPLLESDPPRLLFTYFASEEFPTDVPNTLRVRARILNLSIDLEKVHSIQVAPPHWPGSKCEGYVRN